MSYYKKNKKKKIADLAKRLIIFRKCKQNFDETAYRAVNWKVGQEMACFGAQA